MSKDNDIEIHELDKNTSKTYNVLPSTNRLDTDMKDEILSKEE
jgi:hypothetical protein